VYQGPVLAPSTGDVFISEIADPNNNASARFVEITNGSANPIDISAWEILIYFNTNNSSTGYYTIPNATILAGNTSYVIANNGTSFQTAYGFVPDAVGFNFNFNGNDNIELRDNINTLKDIFGIVGIDGTGSCSEFEDGRALRLNTIIEGNTIWDESEWQVWADSTISGCTNHTNSPQNAPADFTPGSHPN